MKVTITPARNVSGRLTVPGDKSISHRILMLAGLARGVTDIRNLSTGGDVKSTAGCLKALGIEIYNSIESTRVIGGAGRLSTPRSALDCGNSGTTLRLMMGILAGRPFDTVLTGDASLQKRPMERVAQPLRGFGAEFDLTRENFPPLTVRKMSEPLRATAIDCPVASAQVKSAICLAALRAEGTTRITGKIGSRDHTERMLRYFGALIKCESEFIEITGGQELIAPSVAFTVPGDPSSAAFWMAAALIVPDSSILIENCLLNPTRLGFVRVLERMGAKVTIRELSTQPEPVGSIRVTYFPLRATEVSSAEIPSLIDEIPMLAVVAAFASGTTVIRGAQELRLKESDRIECVASNLTRMGVSVETFADGLSIVGRHEPKLKAADLPSFGDHRIAMAFAIGALGAQGECHIEGAEAVEISYPGFFDNFALVTHV
jgi:3-phosphoshikimate 1-carboxyvinyltransferase